jgi:hypothetical protein
MRLYIEVVRKLKDFRTTLFLKVNAAALPKGLPLPAFPDFGYTCNSMKRDDFIFTIGYQGSVAIIDGKIRKGCVNASYKDLAEKGLYKAAYCAVLESGDAAALDDFLSFFNARVSGRPYGKEDLSRLFGVYGVPEEIKRTHVIG